MTSDLVASENGLKVDKEPFTMVPNWVLREGILDPAELAVYLVLLSHRNHKTGLAWPSINAIVKGAGSSRSTVMRTLAKLNDRGLVATTRRPKGKGDNDSNLYKIGVFSRSKPVDNFVPSKGPTFEDAPKGPVPSVSVTPPPYQSDTRGGVSVTPEEEPSLRKTNEENVRSNLSEMGRSFSFDTISNLASEKQLLYLHNLFIHYNCEIPGPETKSRWEALDIGQAGMLIDSYLTDMPRHHEYGGPESGTVEYDALSPRGQAMAETGFIPDVVAA